MKTQFLLLALSALLGAAQSSHEVCLQAKVVEKNCLGHNNFEDMEKAMKMCASFSEEELLQYVFGDVNEEDVHDFVNFARGATARDLCALKWMNFLDESNEMNTDRMAEFLSNTHLADKFTPETTGMADTYCTTVAEESNINTFFKDRDVGMSAHGDDEEDRRLFKRGPIRNLFRGPRKNKQQQAAKKQQQQKEKKEKPVQQQQEEPVRRRPIRHPKPKAPEEQSHTVVGVPNEDGSETLMDLEEECEILTDEERESIDAMIQPLAYFKCFKSIMDVECKNKLTSVFEMVGFGLEHAAQVQVG